MLWKHEMLKQTLEECPMELLHEWNQHDNGSTGMSFGILTYILDVNLNALSVC